MSEQHIYKGNGSPRKAGLVAPAGAHYVDEQRADRLWIASGYFVEEGEEYTEWLMLEPAIQTTEIEAGTYGYTFSSGSSAQLMLLAGTRLDISPIEPGQAVRSNVELVPAFGNTLQYEVTEPCFARIDPVSANVISLIVTPVSAYTV